MLVMISIRCDDSMGVLKIIWRLSTDSVRLLRKGSYTCAGMNSFAICYEFKQMRFVHWEE
jgi:hypothetical protein